MPISALSSQISKKPYSKICQNRNIFNFWFIQIHKCHTSRQSGNPVENYRDLLLGRGGRCPRASLFMSMAKFSNKVIYISEFSLHLALPKATDIVWFASISKQCPYSSSLYPFWHKMVDIVHRVLAQDSRGQFAQLNMLRNLVQLPAVLIRPRISKRHGEYRGLNVKQKGYSKSHFLHSR